MTLGEDTITFMPISKNDCLCLAKIGKSISNKDTTILILFFYSIVIETQYNYLNKFQEL